MRSRARPRARSGLNRAEMEEMLRSGAVAVDLKQQLSKVCVLPHNNLIFAIIQVKIHVNFYSPSVQEFPKLYYLCQLKTL